MGRRLAPEPLDPTDFDLWVLEALVDGRTEYDWEALAILGSSQDQLLRFYRMAVKAVSLFPVHVDIRRAHWRAHLRRDFSFESRVAGQLDIKPSERSRFARIVGVASNWESPDTELHLAIVWQRIREQKVTLTWLREATEYGNHMDFSRMMRALDAHADGMSGTHAEEYSHPDCHRMFTAAQRRALARHNISPNFARHVFDTGPLNTTISDVLALRDSGASWDYLTAVLEAGVSGKAAARLWRCSVPEAYATAVAEAGHDGETILRLWDERIPLEFATA